MIALLSLAAPRNGRQSARTPRNVIEVPAPIADAAVAAEVFNGPGIPLRELEQRWGVSRNTVRSRADALGVEIVRVSSTDTRWPSEWLALGDALHEHLQGGGRLADFPGARTGRNADQPARTVERPDHSKGVVTTVQPDQLLALLQALRPEPQPQPAADPLRVARVFVEAADLGVALSNAELADLLGLTIKTTQGWADGHQPRFGFALRRHQETDNAPIWWTVERIAATKPQQQLPAASEPAPVEHRGMFGLMEDMARPAAYLAPPVEIAYRVMGRELFDRNRIG